MRPTTGQVASVEFDGEWVVRREETKGDVIGFFHTHPAGLAEPSQRDHRTMRAWVSSFGKPLLCLIQADDQIRAFQYVDDQSEGLPLTACELLPRGIVIAYDDGNDDGNRAENSRDDDAR